ncbi:hypothetical protein KPL37_01755 [Clostridium frigoris]|uniref:Uncharacterized protein n=1 Tax=Clostridium frigoris TaxID=205327 RepID=A0ABS6BNJ1_9CLOT|nr:hypothetical protein [Clostridium frigoris]MBU3158496.1 hypothetical protein [Clostridium frigoris]
MKIKKNLSILVLALIIILSGMMGTFVYAYKYTTSHATISHSFPQGGNGKMQQGNLDKKVVQDLKVILRIKVVLNLTKILQVEVPRNKKLSSGGYLWIRIKNY